MHINEHWNIHVNNDDHEWSRPSGRAPAEAIYPPISHLKTYVPSSRAIQLNGVTMRRFSPETVHFETPKFWIEMIWLLLSAYWDDRPKHLNMYIYTINLTHLHSQSACCFVAFRTIPLGIHQLLQWRIEKWFGDLKTGSISQHLRPQY